MGAKARIMITLLAALAVAAAGWGAISVAGGAERAPAQTVDVSGPCDEAEHANDRECVGADLRPEDEPTPEGEATPDDEPGDISGPCDEAEHANDPRCTRGRVDPSGPSDDNDRDDDEDSSGPGDNSGPGSNSEGRSGSNSGRG